MIRLSFATFIFNCFLGVVFFNGCIYNIHAQKKLNDCILPEKTEMKMKYKDDFFYYYAKDDTTPIVLSKKNDSLYSYLFSVGLLSGEDFYKSKGRRFFWDIQPDSVVHNPSFADFLAKEVDILEVKNKHINKNEVVIEITAFIDNFLGYPEIFSLTLELPKIKAELKEAIKKSRVICFRYVGAMP